MRTTPERLDALEQRLTEMERYLGIPTRRAGEAYKQQVVNHPLTNPEMVAGKPLAIRPVKEEETQPGNWLAYAAIVCFVLAAGFIIKLSIDSGWLTPLRQMAIASLFGGGLIATGLALLRIDRAYASYLPATGIIVLYLTILASHSYYGLISLPMATMLVYGVSMGCIALYLNIRHDLYPLCASIGSYAAPVIMGLGTGAGSTGLSPDFILYYFLLCSGAFAIISIALETRTLAVISAYLAIFLTAFIGQSLSSSVAAILLPVNFGIFVVATYAFSVRTGKSLTEEEAWSFFPVLTVFYISEYKFLSEISEHLAQVASLGFAATLLALYVFARKVFSKALASQSPLVAFVSIILFHAGYLGLLPEAARPWLLPLAAFTFAFFPPVPANLALSQKNWGNWIAAALLATALSLEYVQLLGHLLDHGFNPLYVILAFTTAMGAFTAYINKCGQGGFATCVLGAAHALAVMGLYHLAEPHGSFAVSAAWLVYASGIMGWGLLRRDSLLAKSALLVLAVATAKALLVDAASAATIVRIGCLMLTGAVLYGSGMLLRHINRWPTNAK